jgi:uncharacterized membrane protein YhaH (DUF805 family)
MFNYFTDAITKHYFDFQGRARRAAFWYYYLFYIILIIVANIVDGLLHTKGLIAGLLSLALLLPTLGLTVRRYHDSDHSGWWVLCPLMNIVFLFFAGTAGANKYGPDPKAA